MSDKAKSAIIDASRTGQGGKVRADIDTEWELVNRGSIGKGGGLTRKGSIEQERARNALLDEMFGPL